ncbi:MAG: nuclear transport factor 2 family protein [Thermoproteota archaeon]|nr:nuclear transport factor 2 family protein [Thermoproteota archaeon]
MAAPITLKAEDKLQIIELSSRYNKTLDHRDVDGWLETWIEDGTIETPFGNAKGRTSLRVFLNGYFGIAKGKRHWTSNYMIFEGDNRGSNTVSTSTTTDYTSATMSCDLIIFKTEEIPTIFTTGIYVDELKKIRNIWKFSSRKLNLDSMSWHRTSS